MKIETKEDSFKYKDGTEEKYTTHTVDYKGSAFWFDEDDEPELYDMIAALVATEEFYIYEDKTKNLIS